MELFLSLKQESKKYNEMFLKLEMADSEYKEKLKKELNKEKNKIDDQKAIYEEKIKTAQGKIDELTSQLIKKSQDYDTKYSKNLTKYVI